MMITLECPECKTRFAVDNKTEKRELLCPKCGITYVLAMDSKTPLVKSNKARRPQPDKPNWYIRG